MKRISLLFCIMILFVSFLTGCMILPRKNTSKPDDSNISDDSSVTEPDNTKVETALTVIQNQISQSGCAAGVAFLGYVDSELTLADVSIYLEANSLTEKYPFLMDESCSIFVTEGQELYVIVPASANGTITVYPSYMTDNGEYADDKSKPLYVGKPGEAIVLRCNLSEIYSNVLITVTDGGGAIDFRPALSMENGHFQETAGVYDCSIYEEEQPAEYMVEIAMEILRETDEVKFAMEQGMDLLYTGDTQVINGGTCMIFALGTDHDGQFVREQLYAVGDNIVYAYDAINDTWSILGVG